MGDFLLDFRIGEVRGRSAIKAASLLKFCEETKVKILERETFALVLTRVDDFDLWGPCVGSSERGPVWVALAGRIALEEQDWDNARRIEGGGGLACKFIFELYRKSGISALESLNGNYVVFIHDEGLGKFYIITDRCGMFLVYGVQSSEGTWAFCSHPDVLAAVSDENQTLDLTSLTEFLMTGRVTFPYTYYRKIRALATGSIHSFVIQNGRGAYESERQYFQFNFKVDRKRTEWEAAEGLAAAFKKAVRRRTLPLFGRPGIALSGGLDSRAVLSAAGLARDLQAFVLFDEENVESRTAMRIAEASGVPLIPIKRDPEYYGNSAEQGVRISGGTGCIMNNHFLGIRWDLIRHGIQNILTGCYCDYIFKGLALNVEKWNLRRIQKIGRFHFEFYKSCHWFPSRFREEVNARLHARFPESDTPHLSDADWLDIEQKRTFPLACEVDSAQRLIPQRVMPWYLPACDNDLVEMYLQIPSRYKLNASLFRKMLILLCDQKLCSIPDSNTGAPITASGLNEVLHRYCSAVQNKTIERFPFRLATRKSWPNWEYYIHHSRVVRSLWQRKNEAAKDLLKQIVGSDPWRKDIQEYQGKYVELFLRFWTLKLWLDQRI